MSRRTSTGFRREIIRRAILVSLLVGTILALINHGDALFTGAISGSVVFRVVLTYFVPFCVSLYSGVRADRRKDEMKEG